MALKTGLVELTVITKHACRLLRTFRPAMNLAISQAVTAGLISSTQSAVLATWLDGAQTACDILRLVTKY